MRVFFIVYTARTGSTALWMYLNQHPNLGVVGDLFQRKTLTGSWARGLGRTSHSKLSINAYMSKVVETLSNKETQAVGIKVSFNWLRPGSRPLHDLIVWTRENRPHIIHIERLNKAKQEISHRLAIARKEFHLLPGQTVRQVPISVEPIYLSSRMKKLALMDKSIVDRFSKGFPYIRVTYEDFIAHTDNVINRICDFLDVPHMDSLPLPTEKIAPRDLSTVIKNYDQIKGLL